MSLRGTRKRDLKDWWLSSSDSDSDSDEPTAADRAFIVDAPPTSSARRKRRQRFSQAGNLIRKDKDYIVIPEDTKEEEKPEDEGIGYNHHPKWPKATNQKKREFRFLPRKKKN